jgi:hypothetical protein
MPVTNRALRLTITRSTVIDVPAGTELDVVPDGMGKPLYAVRNPERFLPEWNAGPDSFGRHDLAHRYAYVPADAVSR